MIFIIGFYYKYSKLLFIKIDLKEPDLWGQLNWLGIKPSGGLLTF